MWIIPLHLVLLLALFLMAWSSGGPANALCHWDCAWYEQIAVQGYSSTPRLTPNDFAQGSWAFFPLYPLLIRAVAGLTGSGAHAAGFALNGVLFPVLVLLAVLYMRDRTPVADKDRTFCVLMLMLLPTTLWYRLPYTECLYGVLLLGCVMAMSKRRTLLAALLACALCLTRPTGLFCVLIAAAFHVLALPSAACRSDRRDRLIEGVVIILAGATGLSLFIFFLDRLLGDGLAFAHVQAAWGHRLRLPVVWIWHGFKHSRTIPMSIAALAEIALIIWSFRIRWRMESVVLLVTFLLASSTSMMSIHRIVLANPFANMLLTLLACKTPPRWRPCLVVLCLVTDAFLMNGWMHGKRFLA
ncbi:hypothetical protein [Acetobacter fallax]|uniref:Mannosyltransferase n=1 Tax=Acetobacter fallax TaxID=1737473 RepID=A0ABX0KHI9_9PROT|nr:hypothetical protein [Acetobacter fallax]NHO33377.1 hypothetical protein [Acetobacter fallax]NHO36996.1 hypothetical protein [Acetobacter fallax]